MRTYITACALVAVLLATVAARGASTTEQRRQISSATSSLRIAERMARAERYDEALEALAQAQTWLQTAAEDLDERLQDSFDRTRERLQQLHADLKAAGAEVPPLADFATAGAAEGMDAPPPTLGSSLGGVDPMERVSFVEHVVPILTQHCGGCHVGGSRGGVSLGDYNSITEQVVEGAGIESRLINVIVSGQMPPEGKSVVSPAETRALVNWINQGAKFDGDDPTKKLGQLQKTDTQPDAPQAGQPAENMAAGPIPMATGNESVSFALDIAPLLVDSCNGCHGQGGSRSGLSVANFEQLWKGGDRGPAIVPGDSKASLLVQKLRGTAEVGARMPQNRPAWPAAQIELVARWIDEGAKFDGSSVIESLARVASEARLTRSTPEQLSADRATQATDQWRLAIPDERAHEATSDRFLVIGNLPEQALEQLAQAADEQLGQVLEFLKQPRDSLGKGRVTIFAFDHPLDYREFGTMVERRSLPAKMRGHARYDAVYPYVALVPDQSSPERTTPLLTAQLAQLCIAHRADGRLPAWFSNGAGMAVAAKLHRRAEIVETWRAAIPTALANIREPDGFMNGKLPPDTTTSLGFGFCDTLLQKPENLHRLMKATAETGDFEAACQSVFNRSPSELAKLWVAAERRRR